MIPIEGLAFLDAIAIGEDYDPLDYDELVGGDKFEDFSQFPQWDGQQFSTGISHAAGRYQFEPATWRQQAQRLGLTDFSPASQDAGAWDLAQAVYHSRMGVTLIGDLQSKRARYHIVSALHTTWTSIGPATWDRYCGALTARRMIEETDTGVPDA